jgi:large subunit ribosomal protein L18
MQSKQEKRIRRSRQTRARIAVQRVARISVYRSNSHIYASLISDDGARILATASTVQKVVVDTLESPGGATVAAAAAVGKRIAELAKAVGVERVAFDRAGFAYHGRVKALADAAREAGLQF